ncbi:RNA methyltransferase, partial [Francisella tularensis subsp. holarctica]
KRLPQQQIIAILVTEKAYNPNYPLNKKYIINEKDFEALSQTQNPQGVLILAEKLNLEQLSFDDDFILLLDRIQDPVNICTILSTAIAVGLKDVILINGTVDPFNPKAI